MMQSTALPLPTVSSAVTRPTWACVWLRDLPYQIARKNRDITALSEKCFAVAEDGVALPRSSARSSNTRQRTWDKRLAWVSYEASLAGITVGMLVRKAMTLMPGLTVFELTVDEHAREHELIHRALSEVSPTFEPSSEAGIYFVDAQGMRSLFGHEEVWAQFVCDVLQAKGYAAKIAVGFSRHGAYANVKALAGQKTHVFAAYTETHEREHAGQVALRALHYCADAERDPSLIPLLNRLVLRLADMGVVTLRHLLPIQAEALQTRFSDLKALRSWFLWATWIQPENRAQQLTLADPLRPKAPVLEHQAAEQLDEEETRESIVFRVRRHIAEAAARFAKQGKAIANMHVALVYAVPRLGKAEHVFGLSQQQGSNEVATWQRLLLLKMMSLESAQVTPAIAPTAQHETRGYEAIRLHFRSRPGACEQTMLLDRHVAQAEQCEKQLQRAVERVQARWGQQAVLRACKQPSHIFAEQIRFEPWCMQSSLAPKTAPTTTSIVRRIHSSPQPFAWSPHSLGYRHERALPHRILAGPFVKDDAWWSARPLQRSYYYIEQQERVLWVYVDHEDRKTYLQGCVA